MGFQLLLNIARIWLGEETCIVRQHSKS